MAIALGVAACGGAEESGGGGVKADQNAGGTVGKGAPAQKGGELTVGLAEDPDQLDPTLARTFVGRIVFANMCEKLYDIDENLKIVPQLAAGLPDGVGRRQDHHDQAPAAASSSTTARPVRRRRGQDVARPPPHAEGVEPRAASSRRSTRSTWWIPAPCSLNLQARSRRSTASSPTARAWSCRPRQLKKLGDKFGATTRCASGRSSSSSAPRHHIVLDARAGLLRRVEGQARPARLQDHPRSSDVRLANLRSGDVDVIDRLGPTDAADDQEGPEAADARR